MTKMEHSLLWDNATKVINTVILCFHDDNENISNRNSNSKRLSMHWLASTLLGTLHASSHSIPTAILKDWIVLYLHLTNERTKAQRRLITCLQSHKFSGPSNSGAPSSSLLCCKNLLYLVSLPLTQSHYQDLCSSIFSLDNPEMECSKRNTCPLLASWLLY